MHYNEALEYIHSLLRFGIKPGLQRVSEALNKLGNPHKKLKFVHIAGTNGKGSTSTMIAQALRYTGLKVGLYTSPYVVDFTERIQINGEYIPKERLAALTKKVIATKVSLTEFEFITALAFLYFYEEKCDVVVLETGLGGRFDATNVIESPSCCVITRIDYDHTAILGDTIEKIAFEKCGIIKTGAKVVSYPLQDNRALSVIKNTARDVIVPNIEELNINYEITPNNEFYYCGVKYKTSLCGRYQIYNAITALEALKAIGIDITQSAVVNAFYDAFIPARTEVISTNPLVVLDGAHNPNGAEALTDIAKNYKNITAIVGMMADKDVDQFLQTVMPYCKNVVTVTVESNPRSMTAAELKNKISKHCSEVFAAEEYIQAISKAKELSNSNPIFVFGSLYLAGEIRPLLKSSF